MGASAEQVLNESAGKPGHITIFSTDGEVSASDMGYDSFSGILVGSVAATFKAKAANEILLGEEIRSDISDTGDYADSAVEQIPGTSFMSEYTDITVTSGSVMAFLGRKTTSLQAANPK